MTTLIIILVCALLWTALQALDQAHVEAKHDPQWRLKKTPDRKWMRVAVGCVFLALALGLAGCATMGPNDGLVPLTSAQSNLPFIPASPVTGRLAAAPSGPIVYPLNETRKAYWSVP
jgi:hypothetical protein